MNDRLKIIHKSDPISAPEICILTCYNEAYEDIADITVLQIMKEYASRWGHDLVALTKVDPSFIVHGAHVDGLTWDRLREAVNLIESECYKWIYILGADTLITNMTIPLESIIDESFHFIIARDMTEWNADSILIKCSHKSLWFLNDVLLQFDRLKSHPIVEQQAMIERREFHKGMFKEVPQRVFNAYNYTLFYGANGVNHPGHWHQGDFLIHWAGRTKQERLSEIQRVLPMIVR